MHLAEVATCLKKYMDFTVATLISVAESYIHWTTNFSY